MAENKYRNGRPLQEYRKDENVTSQEVPWDVLRPQQHSTEQMLQAEAENDVDFKRIRGSRKQFQEANALWEERAHLPGDLNAAD